MIEGGVAERIDDGRRTQRDDATLLTLTTLDVVGLLQDVLEGLNGFKRIIMKGVVMRERTRRKVIKHIRFYRGKTLV